MSRATTKGGRTFSPLTFVAFVLGMGIGFVLVSPVLPERFGTSLVGIVQGSGTVILAGVLALAALMVLLAVLYQGYLRA